MSGNVHREGNDCVNAVIEEVKLKMFIDALGGGLRRW